MSIDPNELAIWDDDLAEAWHDDKRLTLLMRMDKYGVPYAQTQWALTLDRNCKLFPFGILPNTDNQTNPRRRQ